VQCNSITHTERTMEHMVDVIGHLMDDMPCVLSRTSVKEAADDVDRMALTGFAVEAVKKKESSMRHFNRRHAMVARCHAQTDGATDEAALTEVHCTGTRRSQDVVSDTVRSVGYHRQCRGAIGCTASGGCGPW
jgi:hypothetical protein